MTPFAATIIPKEDLECFRTVVRLVHALPDIHLGRHFDGEPVELTCHMLAIALGNFLGLEAVHGYYLKGFEHSWLHGPKGSVIDPYPVGAVGGPIMVENERFGLSSRLYLPVKPSEHKLLYGSMFHSQPFVEAVKRLTRALKKL